MKKILVLVVFCLVSLTTTATEKELYLDSIQAIHKETPCAKADIYLCYFHDDTKTNYIFSHTEKLSVGKKYHVTIDEPREVIVYDDKYYALLRLRKTPD